VAEIVAQVAAIIERFPRAVAYTPGAIL